MRPLLFRCYDKRLQFMYGSTSLAEMLLDPPIFKEEHVLMQYTGMHDNKRHEIYEGDILFNSFARNYWEVSFADGGFVVTLLPDNTYCEMLCNVVGFEHSAFTIFGNIYSDADWIETLRKGTK
jgi:YopX protein